MKRFSTKKRALLQSTLMLLVAAIALGSATYAWFTSQNFATVRSLEVSVTAPTGLLIATGGTTTGAIGTWVPPTLGNFGSSITIPANRVALTPVSGFVTATAAGAQMYPVTLNNTDPDGNGDAGTAVAGAVLGNDATGYWVSVIVWARLASGDTPVALTAVTEFLNFDTTENDGTPGGTLDTVLRLGIAGNETTNIFARTDTPDYIPVIGTGSGSTNAFVMVGPTTPATGVLAAAPVTPIDADNTATATLGDIGMTPVPFLFKVWVEGQDPDCTNVRAAEFDGGNVNITLNIP